MPNSYHYFESGEVSLERFEFEIELLKQLQDINLLDNLNWNNYDTIALQRFQQAGIYQVNQELIQRQGNHSKKIEQSDFIKECIEKYRKISMKKYIKKEKFSLLLCFNMSFVFICLIFVISLFIYQYIKFNHQHPLFQSLNYSLTTKRRHLSFTDDLPIFLLTFACAIILGSIIIATRFSQKIILLGIFTLIIIIFFLIIKLHQIISFLSKYREFRWRKLYDYMYS